MKDHITILFLRSHMSRNKFMAAMEWLSTRSPRVYLRDEKLWIITAPAHPGDEDFETFTKTVTDEGWTIAATTMWSTDMPLHQNKQRLSAIARVTQRPKKQEEQ